MGARLNGPRSPLQLPEIWAECLAQRVPLSYPDATEVRFTPEQQERLAHMAAARGTDAEHLVQRAALSLLEEAAQTRQDGKQYLVEKMRAIRTRVKPDPDGWTTRDYVLFGRR